MRKRRGFTLGEMLVGLLVSAIVCLMVGAIGSIGVKSYQDFVQRSSKDSDLYFAIESIRSAVRHTHVTPTVNGTTLTIDTQRQFVFDGTHLLYVVNGVANRVLSNISSVSWNIVGSVYINIELNYTKAGKVFHGVVKATRRNR